MIDYISEFKKIKELQSCPNCNKQLKREFDSTWKCCGYKYVEKCDYENIVHYYLFFVNISDNIYIFSEYYVDKSRFNCNYVIRLNHFNKKFIKSDLQITDLLSKPLEDLIDETKVMILFS